MPFEVTGERETLASRPPLTWKGFVYRAAQWRRTADGALVGLVRIVEPADLWATPFVPETRLPAAELENVFRAQLSLSSSSARTLGLASLERFASGPSSGAVVGGDGAVVGARRGGEGRRAARRPRLRVMELGELRGPRLARLRSTSPGPAEPALVGRAGERASRYRAPDARDRFVAARAALREILGRYARPVAGAPAVRYPCACGRAGCEPSQPEAASRHRDDSAARFNLSHTDGLALSRWRESARSESTWRRFVRESRSRRSPVHVLGADEAEALAALPERERLDAFYGRWTRREAHAKARGDGLAPAEEREAKSGRWWLTDLMPPPRYRAALAVEGGECAVVTRWWP